MAEVTLREEIEVLLQAYDFRKRTDKASDLCQAVEDFAGDAEGLLKRVLNEDLDAAPGSESQGAIKAGDRVRNRLTKEYLGVVSRIRTVVSVSGTNSGILYDLDRLEVAPQLTTTSAWVQTVLDIEREIAEIKNAMAVLYEPDQRELRHGAYVLLGAAGVKVTEEVKREVREIIRTVASHFGVRLV